MTNSNIIPFPKRHIKYKRAKLKNYILYTLNALSVLGLLCGYSLIDRDCSIPGIIISFLSLLWLGLFVKANEDRIGNY